MRRPGPTRKSSCLSIERLEERQVLSTLVAAYNFNEGSGTVLHDFSGNGNNGTILNAAWSSAGKYGDALSFNGTNAQVNIPDAASLQLTTAMTLEAWVEPTAAANGWQDILNKGNYFLDSSSPANVPAAGGLVNSLHDVAYGTAALPTHSWSFLTAVYDGTTMWLLVNGVVVGSQAGTGSLGASVGQLQIGEYLQGLIDNVRIYNTALTRAQIQADMNTPIAGSSASLILSPATLPDATVNSAYSATLSASGGSGTYTFAVTSGSLPSGLTLNPTTGVLSGTPITSAASTFTISATDSNTAGLTGSQAYTLNVNPVNSLTLSPAALPSATVNSAYSATLTATGGSGTYTFAVTSGSLPSWLSLNATTGVLSGTPTANGTSTFTIIATDRKTTGLTGDRAYTLTVNQASSLTVSPSTLLSATVNSAYSATLSVSGGSGRYTFAVTGGNLPSWLTLNATTGVLSGTPTMAGIASFTITATDSGTAGLTGSQAYTVLVNEASRPAGEPLLYQSNLQYVGAFRVPAVPDPLESGTYTFSFGGTALAFNPVNQSLFLVGMPYEQAISEISIPQSIVNSSNLSNLATSRVLQGPVDVLSKLPSNPLAGGTGGVDIGGLMADNGQLIGTAYINYDALVSATVSHFKLSSLNLSTAQVGGLYRVGNLGGGLVGGYMVPIPSEWQAALGAPFLTGQADRSIISRTSSGPAAFGFDPQTLGSGVTPITPYVYYPSTTPLGPYEGPANPLQSGTAQVNGVVFAPGTSTVLFFGTTGTNYDGYGEAATYGDTNHTAKGPHSLNGQYAFQAWAYNVNDLIAVKQARLQPWQVQPYDVWNFNLPNADAGNQIGGVAFDPATGRVYVSALDSDKQMAYTDLPLIEVFQLSPIQPAPATQVAPQVGTLAATPGTLSPGPIPQGTAVTLTAGNVYAINNGASVAQVAFYLDSNNDGVLAPGTDQLLGYGNLSNIPNASHNWTLTISTSGLAPGTYTVFAEALDSSGVLSDPIATTLTMQ